MSESRMFARLSIHHKRTSRLIDASIFETLYGLEMKDLDDEHIELAERAMKPVVEGFLPGKCWVDFIPFLRYIPGWPPDASFKHNCAIWREQVMELRNLPCKSARNALVGSYIFEIPRVFMFVAHMSWTSTYQSDDTTLTIICYDSDHEPADLQQWYGYIRIRRDSKKCSYSQLYRYVSGYNVHLWRLTYLQAGVDAMRTTYLLEAPTARTSCF